MNDQGRPWDRGQEAREQLRLNIFTCQGMKGAKAPKSQLSLTFLPTVSPPSPNSVASALQKQSHFLSRA